MSAAVETIGPRVRQGLCELRHSEWETAFFGARMGSIARLGVADRPTDLRRAASEMEAELRRVIQQAGSRGYAHLIFRAPSEDVVSVWAAEAAGLRLVDVGVDSTFTFTPGRVIASEPASQIRSAAPSDTPTLQQLSVGAFAHTRFAVDPFFSDEQVNAFYAQWVNNLFEGLADVVFVYENDSQPVGFVSCVMHGDEGRIPLVAARADQRGRGVGRELIRSALAWFASAGARVAHVKTQAANYSALALYHRAGFTISNTELTFSVAVKEATSRSR